jgi:hypothetical protein
VVARCSPRSDVVAVLVERHGLGGASLELSRPALDLVVPGYRRIGIMFVVQAADQLERQLGALFGGKPEDLGQHVGRGHVAILADSRGRARSKRPVHEDGSKQTVPIDPL